MIIVFIFCFAVRSQILFTFCNLLLSISALVHLSLSRVFFFSFSLDQLVGKERILPASQSTAPTSRVIFAFDFLLFPLSAVFLFQAWHKKKKHTRTCASLLILPPPSPLVPSSSLILSHLSGNLGEEVQKDNGYDKGNGSHQYLNGLDLNTGGLLGGAGGRGGTAHRAGELSLLLHTLHGG